MDTRGVPLCGVSWLIVDGDNEIAQIEESLLQRAGAYTQRASSLAQAIASLHVSRPDGIVLGLPTSTEDGSQFVRLLSSQKPRPFLVLVDGSPDSDPPTAGSTIVLSRQDLPEQLIPSLESLQAARAQSNEVSTRDLRTFARTMRLTKREEEILQLRVSGITPKEIAHRLGISFGTARFHARNLAQKCSTSTLSGALAVLAQYLLER